MFHLTRPALSVGTLALAVLGLAACDTPAPDTRSAATADSAMTPVGVTASPDAQTQAVLGKLDSLGGKPIETLTAAEARQQPTPTDAVMALLKAQGKPTTPEAVGSVVNRTIPGAAGNIPVRIYTPAGTGPFPVIVYYHGGGWVIATNDTYDASGRALANAAGAIVVSVEYRKAPEHRFPAAHDDAFAAYSWVVKNAGSMKGDPKRIAVAGESAGGNLAAATSMKAKQMGIQMPVHQLLVYPVAGTDTTTASYVEHANAKPLNRPMMGWFVRNTIQSPADLADPRLNLVAADLSGMPPTTIINAEIDPLLTEGEMLAERLRAAGVDVRHKTYDGVVHEFFGMGAAVDKAKEAVAYGAEGLKAAFTPQAK